MSNRILKASICDSPNIDQLKPEHEILFYRLIVNCDDYGRMDGRLLVVIAKCYPLKITQITESLINEWIKALVEAELITQYEVEDHPYIQINKWDIHQTIRAKRSKYPAPNGKLNHLQTNEIICKQLITDASKCSRNPIQSNLYIESNPITADDKLKRIIEIYTSNISVNTTPILVNDLKDISKTYELEWFEYAVKEAVRHNAHNLKYIKTILENCAIKGYIPNNQTQQDKSHHVVYKELP